MEYISVYTREQAIKDGVLIDVTQMAKEAGFKVPVAVTNAIWEIIEDIPAEYGYQDIEGRLWDVLFRAYLKGLVFKRDSNSNSYNYKVTIPHTNGHECILTCQIHGGDRGEPVITISLPGED